MLPWWSSPWAVTTGNAASAAGASSRAASSARADREDLYSMPLTLQRLDATAPNSGLPA